MSDPYTRIYIIWESKRIINLPNLHGSTLGVIFGIFSKRVHPLCFPFYNIFYNMTLPQYTIYERSLYTSIISCITKDKIYCIHQEYYVKYMNFTYILFIIPSPSVGLNLYNSAFSLKWGSHFKLKAVFYYVSSIAT